MGMSMYTGTILSAWHSHGSISQSSFSLCFTQTGGQISLGGTALFHPPLVSQTLAPLGRHLEPMVFAPFARTDHKFYSVTIESVSVGEVVLSKGVLRFFNDAKGTIVDSGTTDTFLPKGASTAFSAAWERASGQRYNNKLKMYTYEQFRRLPVIAFVLEGGARWEVRPEAYMEPGTAESGAEDPAISGESPFSGGKNGREGKGEAWSGKRGFVSRVYVDEPRGAVLGSNTMVDHDLVFDVAGMRLGVARADCTLPQ